MKKAQRTEIIRCVWDLWTNNSFWWRIEGQGPMAGAQQRGLGMPGEDTCLTLASNGEPSWPRVGDGI